MRIKFGVAGPALIVVEDGEDEFRRLYFVTFLAAPSTAETVLGV
jgi:hypothetical protein